MKPSYRAFYDHECRCGSGEHAHMLYDGYGIPLRPACSKCEEKVLRGYRRDILERYDCDEPIEPEDY